ncbi:uncharacterized protein B0H64DRAFT_408364 [Chaetomium fimeti]|uniref:Uncharacterized protein n=1 Tax=Chaetomium fimeti TaxID=1854472 RepID=A0AAE0H8Y7_9PEZI|nr:hypothetical protein B0H64DRAFT_408364 [Chaetomium fimeti]
MDYAQTMDAAQPGSSPGVGTILIIERFSGGQTQFFKEVTQEVKTGSNERTITYPDGKSIVLRGLQQFGPATSLGSAQPPSGVTTSIVEGHSQTLRVIKSAIDQVRRDGSSIRGIIYLHRCDHTSWNKTDNFKSDMIRLILGNGKTDQQVKMRWYPNTTHPALDDDRQSTLEEWKRIVADYNGGALDTPISKESLRLLLEQGDSITLALTEELAKEKELRKTEAGRRVLRELDTSIQELERLIKESKKMYPLVEMLKGYKKRLKKAKSDFKKVKAR